MPKRSYRRHGIRPLSTNIRLPVVEVSPLRQIAIRIVVALAILALMVLIVYSERDGYNDNLDGTVDLLDAAYYATVSLSTTGYGDIAPVSDVARLTNVILVTPLRFAFLIVLIGTTLEVLAARSREQWRIARWRSGLRDHTVVVGYGTKGRSAIESLLSGGIPREQIVVVDPDTNTVSEANANGFFGVFGDAARADVLRRAEVATARQVVITVQRDDTAVLVTLTARALNPAATVVTAVREAENVPLLRQSGADVVVTSSNAVGRLMGLATVSPQLGSVLEDLLSYGEGLEVAERAVLPREVGKGPRELEDVCIAVVRGGEVYRFFDPTVSQLLRGDRVVVIRSAEELPWASRPGVEGDEGEGEEDTDADDANPDDINPSSGDSGRDGQSGKGGS